MHNSYPPLADLAQHYFVITHHTPNTTLNQVKWLLPGKPSDSANTIRQQQAALLWQATSAADECPVHLQHLHIIHCSAACQTGTAPSTGRPINQPSDCAAANMPTNASCIPKSQSREQVRQHTLRSMCPQQRLPATPALLQHVSAVVHSHRHNVGQH